MKIWRHITRILHVSSAYEDTHLRNVQQLTSSAERVYWWTSLLGLCRKCDRYHWCLSTHISSLWSNERLSHSKAGSYIKRLLNKSNANPYSDLEDPYRITKHGEEASDRHLEALGPATSIIVDDIPLNERPGEGIQVQTTLSTTRLR